MLVGGGRFHEELGNPDLALSFPKDSEQARGNGFTASLTPQIQKSHVQLIGNPKDIEGDGFRSIPSCIPSSSTVQYTPEASFKSCELQ